MPKYTLIYFDSKGRAEPARYMFHIAGVEFEDRRLKPSVESEEWQALKPSTPLGQLPVLEVDGKQLPQSHAIYRYVADVLGLAGATAWDRAQADVADETIRELTTHVGAIFAQKDETKKAELKKKFEEEHLQKNLEKLEKLLKQNNGGDGWFVGDKVSIADIMSYSFYCDFFPAILGKPELDLSKYEKFAALTKRFRALPEIAEYIKNRPETPL